MKATESSATAEHQVCRKFCEFTSFLYPSQLCVHLQTSRVLVLSCTPTEFNDTHTHARTHTHIHTRSHTNHVLSSNRLLDYQTSICWAISPTIWKNRHQSHAMNTCHDLHCNILSHLCVAWAELQRNIKFALLFEAGGISGWMLLLTLASRWEMKIWVNYHRFVFPQHSLMSSVRADIDQVLPLSDSRTKPKSFHGLSPRSEVGSSTNVGVDDASFYAFFIQLVRYLQT